ncbi:uncharacterized protein [Panulirus ornatus]|uniref:uncharacterized protein n=1 Tax=Panulirus ornatus TaxID=150431 RepID=UPI003A8BE5FC
MNRRPEGLYQSALGRPSTVRRNLSQAEHGAISGIDSTVAFSSQPLALPPDPDRENTDDSGMGADLDDRGVGGKVASDDDDDDEEFEEEEEEEEKEKEEPKTRRTSSAGNDRQRRPSYTCYHGALVPRAAAHRMARRARPRPPRNLDMLQLAAGATVMLAPVTPELLR